MEPKININRPKLSDAEIESKKDFNSLVNKFKQESLQKARKDLRLRRLKKLVYSTVIAGATVFCTVTYINYNSKKTNNDNNATLTETQKTKYKDLTNEKKSTKFIQPISEKTNVAYNNYKVNAKNGGTITHNKSKITIPAGSFVKKNGEEVKGDVEIKYREMHDQADILASGIPMTYDSAGSTFHFESAGMIDIGGSQDGEEVFIKPGKNVKVEMASAEQGTQFNLYALDTVNRKWIFKGKDEVSVGGHEVNNNNKVVDVTKDPFIVKIDNKIQAIEVKKDSVKVVTDKKIVALPKVNEPNAPRENKGDRPKFELDVDPAEHPELSVYKDVVFEIGEENKQYDKSWNQVTWSDAQLTDGPKKGENYILNLILDKRHEKLVVYPALAGKSFEKAMKDYQKKFEQYQVALKKRNDDEERLKKELEAKLKAYNEEQAKLAAEREKAVIKIRQQNETELASNFNKISHDQQIVRTFMVSNFGVWNTDCPNSLPEGNRVNPELRSGNNILHPDKFFLVDHNRNVLFTITEEKISFFRYPKEGTYSICCSVNGQVYICGKEQFRSAKDEGGKKVFETSLVSPEITSVFDLRKGLGLIEG